MVRILVLLSRSEVSILVALIIPAVEGTVLETFGEITSLGVVAFHWTGSSPGSLRRSPFRRLDSTFQLGAHSND
ncbi:hypothetical protein BJ166DRAFT_350487 [Pestalotiopsis sp. NC0098]|nr:hypothetical protein BJ166DRAFT_350487 [Pestalotiopsis sp. NC0098]